MEDSNNATNNATTNNPTNDKPQPTIAELQAQLDALKAEMTETLAAQQKQAEEALVAAKLESASKVTARTSPDISSGAQDVKIEQAIRKVGGLAKWGLLDSAQRAEAIGLSGSTEESDKEIRKFFGKDSSTEAASQLMASNPARYRKLKTEAKLRGIY